MSPRDYRGATYRLILGCLATLLVFLAPALVRAASSSICITADILTDDSGRLINGSAEDVWPFGDAVSTDGYMLPGVRIELKKNNGVGAGIGVFDTGATTGCVTVTNAFAGPYQVIVYGYATDSSGNHVRIHDAGTTTSTNYPGNTYSYGFINITLGAPMTLKLDATADERWTTFAAAAHTLYRFHDGLSGKTFSIGFDTNSSCASSSTYGSPSSNSYIQSGAGYSLIAIARCPTTNQTKSKFLVAHEVGHAIGRQYYGYNGNDASDDTFAAASCTQNPGYAMTSAEFDAIGFKEGYAHFVSARVWNDQDTYGVFTWFGTAFDLAKGPNADAAGGWIGNMCALDDDTNGVSTNYDWLRFYWDFYTQTACTTTPTKLQMQKIYKWTRDNDRTGICPITDGSPGPSNLHDAVYYTIATTLVTELAGCTSTSYMNHNCVGGTKLDETLCN
jgi:hypothetical protein